MGTGLNGPLQSWNFKIRTLQRNDCVTLPLSEPLFMEGALFKNPVVKAVLTGYNKYKELYIFETQNKHLKEVIL